MRQRATLHGDRHILDLLGQAEVEHLDLSARRDEDVAGLEIAVDDALGMRRLERVGHADGQVQHDGHREWPPPNRGPQRLAFDQLHRDEMLAVVLADVVDGADVGVIQRRGRARFAPQPFRSLRVRDEVWRQELEGDGATESGVSGAIDHAHAAGAQRRLDAIVPDRLADRGGSNYRRAAPSIGSGLVATVASRPRADDSPGLPEGDP